MIRRVCVGIRMRLFNIWLNNCELIKNDRVYLRCFYFLGMGKFLRLKKPKLYTEKIQALKLSNTSPYYSILVDKYEVRAEIQKKIGKQYLIPLLGFWNQFEDIDFSKLPNQFVLKTSHGSGSVILCKNKLELDKENAKKILNSSLERNYFHRTREYPYKNAIPRIVAEAFVSDDSGNGLDDYKFFCFHGEMKMLQVTTIRNGLKHVNYFNEQFNPISLRTGNHPILENLILPYNINEMKDIALKLGADFKHLRVDLYNVSGRIYFGELTFHNEGGIIRFSDDSWDLKIGNWLSI